MMKKWKRILGSALAVTTAAVSVSGMSAGAVAFYSTSLEPPKGYTELDDKSFLAGATNYSDAYTVYTDGKAESANLYIFEHYAFNNTGILVSDLDTFEKVYAENQAALGFGGYSKIQDSDKNWLISMCDEKNADGVNSKNPADFANKRDAVLKLTRDLQKAGVLLQSTYHAVCAMGAEGNYYNGIWVKNVEESEKDAVLRLARTVDSDAEVEIRNIDYGDGISWESINVTKVESIYDGIALAEKLQAAYPAAEVGLEYLMSASAGTQTSGEPVDLTAAYYTGDVDNDEAITSHFSGTSCAIAQVRWDIQFPFSTFRHQLQGFYPTWNYLVNAEYGRFATLDRTVEQGAVYQRAFVVASYLVGRFRFFACTFIDNLVLQSAGQCNNTRSFFVFFEESLSLFNGDSAHFSFQFFEVFVYYFAGFIVADSRLITFQYVSDCLCKIIYCETLNSHT